MRERSFKPKYRILVQTSEAKKEIFLTEEMIEMAFNPKQIIAEVVWTAIQDLKSLTQKDDGL